MAKLENQPTLQEHLKQRQTICNNIKQWAQERCIYRLRKKIPLITVKSWDEHERHKQYTLPRKTCSQPDTHLVTSWLKDCTLLNIFSGTNTMVGIFKTQAKTNGQSCFCAVKPIFIPMTYDDKTLDKSRAFFEVEMHILLARACVAQGNSHIVLPIMSFLCNAEEIKEYLWRHIFFQSPHIQHNSIPEFRDWKAKQSFQMHQKMICNRALVHVVECASYGALLEYAGTHPAFCQEVEHWRSILGQFCAGLASLQQRFPTLRLNDSHCSNILLGLVHPPNLKYTYTFDAVQLMIPSYGYEARFGILIWRRFKVYWKTQT